MEMADRKEWKKELFSRLLDQYEKSATYAGKNKVRQVFCVKPSDIRGLQRRFPSAGAALPGKRI